MFMAFQYRGLNHLGLYCTSTVEAWLKLYIHFDIIIELINACIFSLVFIVLNLRDGIESKYPLNVFSEYMLCRGIYPNRRI